MGDAGHSDDKMIGLNPQRSRDMYQLNCELELLWGRHGLLRNLADRVRRLVLKGKVVQEDWMFFRKDILKA